MRCTNATNLHRKSGAAQWRDQQFNGSLVEMFFYGAQRLTLRLHHR
jgi:hypothetical protein